jgi:hypothetical protein
MAAISETGIVVFALVVRMPEIHYNAAKRAAAPRQHKAGKSERPAASAGLAEVAALRRFRLEERSLGLTDCRFIAIVTGGRRRKFLRQHSARTGKLPSGGKDAGVEQEPAASRFRFVHGQRLHRWEVSLAERAGCCASWSRRGATLGIWPQPKANPTVLTICLPALTAKKVRRNIVRAMPFSLTPRRASWLVMLVGLAVFAGSFGALAVFASGWAPAVALSETVLTALVAAIAAQFAMGVTRIIFTRYQNRENEQMRTAINSMAQGCACSTLRSGW